MHFIVSCGQATLSGTDVADKCGITAPRSGLALLKVGVKVQVRVHTADYPDVSFMPHTPQVRDDEPGGGGGRWVESGLEGG